MARMNKGQLQNEYDARLFATQSNLRRYLNEGIGIIQAAQKGDMAEEDAFTKLDELDFKWAKLIVDDLAPLEHIIKGQ